MNIITKYGGLTPSDFIGKTGLIAQVCFASVQEFQTNPDLDVLERCILFTGPPGTGKTSLAAALSLAIAGHPLAVEHQNGQSVTVDDIRRWKADGTYTLMCGKCRVIFIDEIDALNNAALNDARTWLDFLAPFNVVIATTNKDVDKLQDQLQSRFSVHYFEQIEKTFIAQWLHEKHSIPMEQAIHFANGCKGNARSAKADALSWRRAQSALAPRRVA